MRVTLRFFIGALVMSWFVGGVPVAVAGPAKPGAVDLEDQEQVEHGGAPSRRVPCEQVIAQVDRQHKTNHVTDSVDTARQLHTSVLWVYRCMEAYGRRVTGTGHNSAAVREHGLEGLEEEDEPEEVGSEEVGELDAQEKIERRRSRPHPDKERVLRQHARPTPEITGEDW